MKNSDWRLGVASKKKYQADHRADTRGGALSGIPHCVSDSASFLALDEFERAVLLEILRRFNGYNNGEIGITYDEIGERLQGRKRTSRPNRGRIARAITTLWQHGLIAEPQQESWLERLSRTYRLTFISTTRNSQHVAATNDYLRWTPTEAKSVGYAASPEAPPTGEAGSPETPHAGYAASPEISKNGSFASRGPDQSGEAPCPLILCHIPRPKEGDDTHHSSPPEKLGPSAICGECSQSFPMNKRGTKRFCSEPCRRKAEKRRYLERAA